MFFSPKRHPNGRIDLSVTNVMRLLVRDLCFILFILVGSQKLVEMVFLSRANSAKHVAKSSNRGPRSNQIIPSNKCFAMQICGEEIRFSSPGREWREGWGSYQRIAKDGWTITGVGQAGRIYASYL